MIFITEYDIHMQDAEDVGEFRKEKATNKLGEIISGTFGWDITQYKVTTDRYKLEIEAFPIDKWVEFRDKIIEESRKGRSNRTNNIIQMFQELESFGKPVTTNND
jgi:hypothetical protein